jgi:RNA polymerase sigma-70 factor (ECF subfamily)
VSTISHAVHGYISDASLVSEAQSGDHSAFEELCRRHSTKLKSCIRRILGDRPDIEDVLQETLLRAFTHLKNFEGRSGISTWLTRIAINAAFSTMRGKRAVMVRIDDTGEEFPAGEACVLRDEAPDPECQSIQKQKETFLAEGIRRLPPRLRAVVELRLKDGCSGKEIAEKLGISEAAVKSRLLRAQLRLQRRDGLRANRSGQRELVTRGLSRD